MWYWHYLRAQEIAREREAEARSSRLGRMARAPRTDHRETQDLGMRTLDRRSTPIG
jgi:hypothetical protein